MASVVILDASALIGLHDSADPHHDWALEVFRTTLDKNLAMAVLTYAEVLVHPTKAGNRNLFESNIRGLEIEILPLSESSAGVLADLRAKTRLKMPDVIVLHSAIETSGTIATSDKALALAANDLGLQVLAPFAQ